jgi:CDP-diacylglycerol--glycerol-3-phosphate 3-phosphatidyltransferase
MQTVRPYFRYEPTGAAYAEARLRGTVWERVSSVHLLYRLLLWSGAGLARIGVTANGLTYASLLLALAAGGAAGVGHFALAALLFALSGACDVLDGVVARAAGSVSRFGALLDSTVDRLADGLPLIGLVLFYTGSPTVVIPALVMMSGFLVSYVRARAEGLGATLPPLFMRRAERFVLLEASLMLGTVALQVPVAAPLLLLGVSVMGVLNLAGSLSALRAARRALDAPTLSEPASER